MSWFKSFVWVGAFALSCSLHAQEAAPENWFNLDPEQDNVQGVSTERAYKELLKDKKPQKKIVVAVIDSGVDIEHEDLKDVLWTNPKEIAGNGIDDDKNGYVDDVHGWNFIGGKDGNVNEDTYELTRVYAKLKNKKRSKKEEEQFKEVEEKFESKLGELQEQYSNCQLLLLAIDAVVNAMGKDDFTAEEVNALESDDELVNLAKPIILEILKESTMEEAMAEFAEWKEYLENSLNYSYNVDFKPREIVGDNYEKSSERFYGNSDVEGEDAGHGTHVAGIIAAQRGNDIGVEGVANHVEIMAIRAVPNGDERDKDVANAIRYAVDNGAQVINMSFGKAYGWDKKVVDKAVKYAEKKGVLLVHAAGNSSLNIDKNNNFPTRVYSNGKEAKNWLEVGALSWEGGDYSAASFSNYGERSVDIFAPGVDINSTVPQSKYEINSGTSMAAPVVSGVAALIWSYYPELSMSELRSLLLDTAIKLDDNVFIPGTQQLSPFSELSRTGAVINAYKAIEQLQKTK